MAKQITATSDRKKAEQAADDHDRAHHGGRTTCSADYKAGQYVITCPVCK